MAGGSIPSVPLQILTDGGSPRAGRHRRLAAEAALGLKVTVLQLLEPPPQSLQGGRGLCSHRSEQGGGG